MTSNATADVPSASDPPGESERPLSGRRFLSRKEVLALTTWSISTLRRREREGLFPQHVQDKGRALYPEDEVLACLKEMKQGRGETAWQVRREERKQQAETLQQEQAMAKSRAELEALAHSPRIRSRARPFVVVDEQTGQEIDDIT